MDKKRIQAYTELLIVAAIWGVAGPVIKFALPEFPPFIFLTYRFFISVLILLPIYFAFKPKFPKSRRERIILTIVGLTGSTINLALTFYGFKYTNVLDAILIGNTSPLFVVVGGVIFLKEKITKREKLGIIIAFLGTLTIIFEPELVNNVNSTRLIGNLLIILANVSWVIYVLLTKTELKHKANALVMTTYMFLLGFITCLPIAIYQSGGLSKLLIHIATSSTAAHLSVWYMAVASGALAYFLYQKGQKVIEASEATLFGYLGPIFAAPLAVFWLKEKITLPFLIGALIIACGVYIAEYKKKAQNLNVKN
jgi:drug/metabolite transporter (DMT)-like permease